MFNDEYAGQGGRYLLDPETGVRTRVDETAPQSTDQPDQMTEESDDNGQTTA